MKIELSNRQDGHKVHRRQLRKLVAMFANRMNAAASGEEFSELSVLLTDDAGIADLNSRYLGRAQATDVLSFGYAALPGEGGLPSGEIIVNVRRAVEEGRRRKQRPCGGSWGPCRELALYIAHGCNHLTGMNDDTPAGRSRMHRREMAWIAEAETAGLLNGLLEENNA